MEVPQIVPGLRVAPLERFRRQRLVRRMLIGERRERAGRGWCAPSGQSSDVHELRGGLDEIGRVSRVADRPYACGSFGSRAARTWRDVNHGAHFRSRSPKHDVLFGLGTGAAGGAFLGATLVGLGGCPEDGCDRLRAAAVTAGVLGGLGALIGPIIGAVRYPFNNAFDVYRGDAASASRTSGITVAPQVTQTRTGVLVSMRF